jgi:hypothetical protein
VYSIDDETRALCRAAAKTYAERERKQLPAPEPIDPLASLPDP